MHYNITVQMDKKVKASFCFDSLRQDMEAYVVKWLYNKVLSENIIKPVIVLCFKK